MTTTTTEKTPLDGLMAQAAALEAGATGDTAAPGAPVAVSAEDQEAAAMAAKIESGVSTVVLGLLKMARAWMAKTLPEIREEWTDEVLKAPADAAVPLIKKHMASMMQVIGSSPEATLMAFALLPMGLGVINAMDKAALREKTEAAAATATQNLTVDS